MSRIGKKPIQIETGVEVKIDNNRLTVKGPKGEISKDFRPEINIEIKDDKIFVSTKNEGEKIKKIRAFWGLTRALINNMIQGVTKGFEKKLEINGVGYRAEVAEKELVLNIGFSHQLKIEIPEKVQVLVEKNIITVSGIEKDVVGQFAGVLRKSKPAEPYKGKGIRYLGEQIRRKVGKKAASSK